MLSREGADVNLAQSNSPNRLGPPADPPDLHALEPLTRRAVVVQSTGVVLNAAATFAAVVFLASHVGVLGSWAGALLALAGFLVGTFVADFVSGLLHWAFDTWFDLGVTPLRRMVFIVREHHVRPQRIFTYGVKEEIGVLSWFALLLSAPLFALALLPGGAVGPLRYALAATGVVISLDIVFMLEFHKWGHRIRRPRAIRILQRMQLLLPPEEHLCHHRGAHDVNYCLITGIADRTLGRAGVFRWLERVVSALTGAVPREDDREWTRKYTRTPGSPAQGP
jgi:ubiquitin-conjugating enzyme E2 variant